MKNQQSKGIPLQVKYVKITAIGPKMVHIQKGPGSKGPKTSLKVKFFLFSFHKA